MATGRLPNPLLYINICRLLDSRLPKKEEMEVPLRIFLEKQQDFQKYQGIEGTVLGTGRHLGLATKAITTFKVCLPHKLFCQNFQMEENVWFIFGAT